MVNGRIPDISEATTMAVSRIPDPTLMARLQLSVKGIDWAASLVSPYQHHPFEDGWSAHHHLAHLIAVETENFHVRIRKIRAEDNPTLERWDTEAFDAGYVARGDIEDLAERFMRERTATVELLKDIPESDWLRTGIWPDGTVVDLAWVAEKVLWHALDHFATLLDMHQEFEPRQAPRWSAGAG